MIFFLRLSFFYLLIALTITASWAIEFEKFPTANVISLRFIPEAPLDDELAYTNLMHGLIRSTEQEEKKRAKFKKVLDRLVKGRTLPDRIDALSGLYELDASERILFCRKIAKIPLYKITPGWLIFQLSQITSEERSTFLQNLSVCSENIQPSNDPLFYSVMQKEENFKQFQELIQKAANTFRMLKSLKFPVLAN